MLKLQRLYRWSLKWISDFITHFIIDVITYPCWVHNIMANEGLITENNFDLLVMGVLWDLQAA